MGSLTEARRFEESDRAFAALAAADATDDMIREPLWTWHPTAAKAVLHERRRRFGIEDERIDPTTLTDDDEEEFTA